MAKNIYHLIAVSLDTRAWGDRRIHKQKDGSILTHEQHLGIFTTVENAELMSQEYLAHLSESDVLLGFFLYERPLDESSETSEEVCLGGHKSVRSYLADGTLNCFSDLDTECVKLFTGRDPGTLKVKKGDYAYAYQRDRVVPMLVGALPPNRKWFERRKRRDPGFAGGDYSDDSYWGLEIDGHFHPFAADVFPAFCPINKAIKKKRLFRHDCGSENAMKTHLALYLQAQNADASHTQDWEKLAWLRRPRLCISIGELFAFALW